MPGTVEAPETVQAATSASQGDRMFQTLYPELSEFPNDNEYSLEIHSKKELEAWKLRAELDIDEAKKMSDKVKPMYLLEPFGAHVTIPIRVLRQFVIFSPHLDDAAVDKVLCSESAIASSGDLLKRVIGKPKEVDAEYEVVYHSCGAKFDELDSGAERIQRSILGQLCTRIQDEKFKIEMWQRIYHKKLLDPTRKIKLLPNGCVDCIDLELVLRELFKYYDKHEKYPFIIIDNVASLHYTEKARAAGIFLALYNATVGFGLKVVVFGERRVRFLESAFRQFEGADQVVVQDCTALLDQSFHPFLERVEEDWRNQDLLWSAAWNSATH